MLALRPRGKISEVERARFMVTITGVADHRRCTSVKYRRSARLELELRWIGIDIGVRLIGILLQNILVILGVLGLVRTREVKGLDVGALVYLGVAIVGMLVHEPSFSRRAPSRLFAVRCSLRRIVRRRDGHDHGLCLRDQGEGRPVARIGPLPVADERLDDLEGRAGFAIRALAPEIRSEHLVRAKDFLVPRVLMLRGHLFTHAAAAGLMF